MDIRYEEWLPTAALARVVTAYWFVAGDAAHVPASAILPDGHVELVFNLGAAVGIAGATFNGPQPERAVVGSLSRALRLHYTGPVKTFGIRLHPARGAAFLATPAASLVDRIRPLAEVCPPLDGAMAALLGASLDLESADGRGALDRVLLDQLRRADPFDAQVVAAIESMGRSEGATTVAELAADLGMSSRQLQRRFVAAVGFPPKRFVRTMRFARAWQLASMQPPQTWADLAAAQGYADQAHMVREFRAFGAEPPTQQFGAEWYEATDVSRADPPC